MSIKIFREGTLKAYGESVQKGNIAAAVLILESIKTMLGPKGMNKLVVDSFGEIAATNDGATMLNMLAIHHPVAKVLSEVAKLQDDLVGDGTKTVVIIATGLLKMAEELIKQKIHPNLIIAGYRKALDIALTRLKNVARQADVRKKDPLKKIALTTLSCKIPGAANGHLADLIADAALTVMEERGRRYLLDRDNVQVVKKNGESLMESRLIKGVIIDKGVVHKGMPRCVKNAKIAVINAPLKIEVVKEFKREIIIRDPSKTKRFLDEEIRIKKEMADRLVNLGVNVVFCRRDIDEVVQFFLAKAEILAVRRLLKEDYMKMLTKATGANVVVNLKDLAEGDLGKAELVEEKERGGERMIFIEGCENPKTVCIFLRGGLEKQLDEAERSVKDAVASISTMVENPGYVPGGGAIEEELAMAVRREALRYPGREQLAMLASADALEILPKSLAENVGLDPIKILTELRMWHEKGMTNYGINVFTGRVEDMTKLGIIEPITVKGQALKSGFEVAATLLRIDTIVDKRSIRRSKEEERP